MLQNNFSKRDIIYFIYVVNNEKKYFDFDMYILICMYIVVGCINSCCFLMCSCENVVLCLNL